MWGHMPFSKWILTILINLIIAQIVEMSILTMKLLFYSDFMTFEAQQALIVMDSYRNLAWVLLHI